jgi:hypothetical protein
VSASHGRHIKIIKDLYLKQLKLAVFLAKQYQLVARQNR